jgi:ABC-2 type transport system ATP-binding protein
MEQVEEICDHIILVNKGQKILDGTVKEAKQKYKASLFRIGFDGEVPQQQSDAFNIIKFEDHSLVVKIGEGHSSTEVLQSFLNSGAAITSFNEILPSLNDIFIELVEGTPTARQFQTVTN